MPGQDNQNEALYPTIEDQLFSSSGNWQLNALLISTNKNLKIYSEAYKQAADALLETVIKEKSNIDLQIFPICFLYRHYLELRLKEIILTCSHLLEKDCGVGPGHSLEKLWKNAREAIEHIWPDSGSSDLDGLESCIFQFVKADPNAQGFRYPTDLKANPSLVDVSIINLVNFHTVIQKMINLLESISEAVSQYLSYKYESESSVGERF